MIVHNDKKHQKLKLQESFALELLQGYTPNSVSMYILYNGLHTFPMIPTRRI